MFKTQRLFLQVCEKYNTPENNQPKSWFMVKSESMRSVHGFIKFVTMRSASIGYKTDQHPLNFEIGSVLTLWNKFFDTRKIFCIAFPISTKALL